MAKWPLMKQTSTDFSSYKTRLDRDYNVTVIVALEPCCKAMGYLTA